MDVMTTTVVAGAGLESRVAENPETIWKEIDAEMGADAPSRRRITPDSAQSYGPVWQAMNVIAEDVAQLPIAIYERQDDEGKKRDREHPASYLLRRRPNPELGPFDFKYLLQARALLWGNGYAWIQRDENGTPAALWPVASDQITPVRANGELRYVYLSSDGSPDPVRPEDIIHLRGPGTDELCSPSVVTKARMAIEGGMGAEEHGTAFYRNRARPDIVLEFPEAVDGEAAKNILKRWSSRHGGPSNAGRPGFLDRGGKVSAFSMSHADAQWLEGRGFSRLEIAGWFKLPPHKVNNLDRATFSNIEHQSIEYVTGTVMPWLIRWQDELNYKLLTPSEFVSESHFFEFITNAILRGDSKSRAEFYKSGITDGWLSRNEVRALENLNKRDGLDEMLQPLNMTSPEPEPTGGERARQYAVANLSRRLSAAAKNASKKPAKWLDWLDGGLVTSHRTAAIEVGRACEAEDPTDFADAILGEFRGLMLAAADGEPEHFRSNVVKACEDFVAKKGGDDGA